jgi:hypothetical protein
VFLDSSATPAFTRVGLQSRTRIDLIPASRSFPGVPFHARTVPVPTSDHLALFIDFPLPDPPPLVPQGSRTAFWRFDTKLLEEEDYRDEILAHVADFVSGARPDSELLHWWEDCFKVQVNTFLQSQSRQRVRALSSTI